MSALDSLKAFLVKHSLAEELVTKITSDGPAGLGCRSIADWSGYFSATPGQPDS